PRAEATVKISPPWPRRTRLTSTGSSASGSTITSPTSTSPARTISSTNKDDTGQDDRLHPCCEWNLSRRPTSGKAAVACDCRARVVGCLPCPGSHGPGGSDGVPGGFGGVGPSRWCGPPEGPVGELVQCPPGVLFEPVVVTALRAGVAAAGPPAGLVRGVVVDVALGGGPPAHRAGAGRVPHLDQVLQPDPGI